MEKLRIGGVTVSADGTYSGREVLRLLNISFNNGKKDAAFDAKVIRARGYSDGYDAGVEAQKHHEAANSRTVREFIRLGREILQEGED